MSSAESQSGSTPTMTSREPEATYRPISGLAVTGFTLALASLSAFLHPFLWVLPPIALLVSVYANLRLHVLREVYAGQTLAKIAIGLALLSTISPPLQYFLQRTVVLRQGREWTNVYIDRVLANDLSGAFVLTVSPARRHGKPLEQVITENAESYRTFLKRQDISILAGNGRNAQFTHIAPFWRPRFARVQGSFASNFEYVVQLYDDLGNPTESYRLDYTSIGFYAPSDEWEGLEWQVGACSVAPYEDAHADDETADDS